MAGTGVVMVTTSYPRHEGDFAGHFVASLAEHLVSYGREITVIAPHAPGLPLAEEMRGVRVVRVRYASDNAERLAYGDGVIPNLKRDPLVARTAPGLAHAMRAAVAEHVRDAGIVHAHWAPTAVLAGLGRVDRPVVLSLHGSDVTLGNRGLLFRSLLARGLASADAAIVVAAAQRETVLSRGLFDGPIEVVPSGIESELTARPRTRDAAPGTRFLFVGRLVETKGVVDLVEAFARIAASLPDATLTLAGKGPLEGRVAELAYAHGITSRVELLGEVAHERALELMSSHDALVLPSYGEGSPLVVTEALALGTPVIGTPVGAVPELVRDAGLIVPVGDPAALADALYTVGTEGDRFAALGMQARSRIAEEYGWPTLARRVLEVYEVAAARHGASR